MGAIQDLNCEPWIASGSAEPRLGRCVRKDKTQSMFSLQTHRTIKAQSVIALGFVVFVGVGVLVTKLTVHDLVDVSVYRCGNPETLLSMHQDNPFERMAMSLGKSRVVSVLETMVTMESFTIYHIPLGLLRGQPDLRVMIECVPAHGESSANTVTI